MSATKQQANDTQYIVLIPLYILATVQSGMYENGVLECKINIIFQAA